VSAARRGGGRSPGKASGRDRKPAGRAEPKGKAAKSKAEQAKAASGKRLWGNVAAALACVVVAVCLGRSLPLLPQVLIGAFAGCVGGLTVARRADAPLVAGLAAGLTSLVARPWFVPLKGADAALGWALAVGALAAAAAWAVTFVPAKRRGAAVWVVLGALVLMMWVNVIGLGSRAQRSGETSFITSLSMEPQTEQYRFDAGIYFKTFYLMRQGKDFYQAFREAFKGDARMEGYPGAVFNFREPYAFYLWSLLAPGDARGILYMWLALASGALIAAHLLAATVVRRPLALVGPFALYPYLLFPATGHWLPFVEYWGAALGVISAALVARSIREGGAKGARREGIAAALAAAAALVREHMIYVIAAGLASALADKTRRRRALFWAGAGLAFLAGWGLHYSAVRRVIPAGGTISVSSWLSGGLDYIGVTVLFGQQFLMGWDWAPSNKLPWQAGFNVGEGAQAWLVVVPFLLVAAGTAGALAARPLPLKVFLVISVLLPFTVFAFFGTGEWGGYWGAVVMPMALAAVPMAFAWLPHARRRGT
jgi:hypothetical protein